MHRPFIAIASTILLAAVSAHAAEEEIVVEPENPEEVEGVVVETTPEGEERIVVESEEGSGANFEIRIGEERITLRTPRDRAGRGGERDAERVLFGEDIVISEDEVVTGDVVAIKGSIFVDGVVEGEVVAIGGDVIVTGEVYDTAVAILGNVELDPGAVCGGDVVSIGGRVDRNAAQIDGQSYSISVFPGSGEAPQLRTASLVLTAFSLLSYMLFLLVLAALFGHNTRRMVSDLHGRAVRCFGIGLLVHIVSQVALVLLLITVIGAPVAFIGWVVWWGIAQTAEVLGGIRLGRFLTRSTDALAVPGIVGGLLLHTLWIVGFLLYSSGSPGIGAVGITLVTIGFGLDAVLILMGTGALFGSRFGGRRSERIDEEPLFDTAVTPEAPTA